jgi:crossover junction endodeoxyribonuclease RuvC
MIICGIDPGASGAVVVYSTEHDEFCYTLMPTMEVGKATRVNGSAVAGFLKQFQITAVFLEKVGSMPKQGVTSVFNFGHSTGVVDGVCSALGLPITLVTPQAWKKHAGLIGTEKDASRSRCVQLYPSVVDLHKKGKGQAIADALLIAKYGAAMLKV